MVMPCRQGSVESVILAGDLSVAYLSRSGLPSNVNILRDHYPIGNVDGSANIEHDDTISGRDGIAERPRTRVTLHGMSTIDS